MAKLDNEELRRRILAQIAAGDGLRPACKAVGIAHMTLHRYMKAHPEFADEVAAAKAGAVPPLTPPRSAPPRLREAAVELEIVRPEPPAPKDQPTPAPVHVIRREDPAQWWASRSGMAEKAAAMVESDQVHPGLQVAAWRYLSALDLARQQPAEVEDVVYVELPPKDAAADG